ncbi:MAG: hypothetical protein ACE5G2_10980, partial [Candidatus Krumholzibacteriia bacterium]
MSGQRRILLISSGSTLSPVLRTLAQEKSLQFVRAHDAHSAFEHLQHGRFACALLDLDALGD